MLATAGEKTEGQQMKWSEAGIISALGTSFEWHRRICCPNVMLGYNCEADFVLITESDILWECEIKISVADWKADNKKDRRYHIDQHPARFYYAVPDALVANGIPEWVRPDAGVLVLRERDDGRPSVARWLRVAKVQHKHKVRPELKAELLKKVYFRYWRHVAPVLRLSEPKTIEIPE